MPHCARAASHWAFTFHGVCLKYLALHATVHAHCIVLGDENNDAQRQPRERKITSHSDLQSTRNHILDRHRACSTVYLHGIVVTQTRNTACKLSVYMFAPCSCTLHEGLHPTATHILTMQHGVQVSSSHKLDHCTIRVHTRACSHLAYKLVLKDRIHAYSHAAL
jgi:hypothetical protein